MYLLKKGEDGQERGSKMENESKREEKTHRGRNGN